MAPKRVIQATTPGAHGISPIRQSPLQDIILEKVLEQLDLTGLSLKIIDDVATKISGRGSVETLIETVLQREGQGLAERLEELVLERLAYECEAGGQATVVPLVVPARSSGSSPLT